jgi:predicted N-acyltransferase
MKLLMVGCAAGEGQMASTAPWALTILHEALPAVARRFGASVIVLKDCPADYRAALARHFPDYRRVPGMPAATLDLTGYSSFEDYLQRRVGKVYRKNLRRKFRKLDSAAPIIMEVLTDARDWVPELFSLYWQTFERSEFQFEVLNREFFERLGGDMPDKTRFFIWRQEGRIIAFNVCLVDDGVIYDLDLGMDYSIALDLHLYFVTWRDIVQWSMENGLRMYHTGPLNYDPKLHLKLKLAPQDIYARSVTGWMNPFFKIAMGFMHPVRHDRVIRQFENARDL